MGEIIHGLVGRTGSGAAGIQSRCLYGVLVPQTETQPTMLWFIKFIERTL